MPAVFTGAGAQVNDIVRGPHHRLVMLHHDYRVAHVPQPGQGIDQAVVVVGMQPHRRLVANVEHTGETGTNLGSQAHPLGFTAGERPGGAVHRNVVQADAVQKVESARNFLEYLVGDSFFPRSQDFTRMIAGGIRVNTAHPIDTLADVHRRNFHYAQTANFDAQGFGLETVAVASLAGAGGHITLYFLAGVVGIGLFVAA